MKRIGRLVLKLLAFVALCAGLYIGATNRDLVTVDLLFLHDLPVRAGYLIVFSFAAGGLVGLLAGILAGRRAGGRAPLPARERNWP